MKLLLARFLNLFCKHEHMEDYGDSEWPRSFCVDCAGRIMRIAGEQGMIDDKPW